MRSDKLYQVAAMPDFCSMSQNGRIANMRPFYFILQSLLRSFVFPSSSDVTLSPIGEVLPYPLYLRRSDEFIGNKIIYNRKSLLFRKHKIMQISAWSDQCILLSLQQILLKKVEEFHKVIAQLPIPS